MIPLALLFALSLAATALGLAAALASAGDILDAAPGAARSEGA